ncbi:ATPase, histidine kinase-, DNA gyrase B (macronuclear) [Tetrahymena thermophila SB210]|uniref:histidine kinase n=1 Tax=Tetrahymena thermophila (strain SB210) TaxID=312017 RepID=Q22RZ0_TETTS|nr:ATPase, histidine kinase-, DNA gyrase B [Tetrahymena thermophila SB210]EAR87982.2 ATPase, histidine kinase-, DNA gyrase B [Tetrahymena thermophila SB210]|eukprot:XP_001008227.2 ATPase, histidine kinase-, DNA gyrase B [Tetrahymena thermophila SB210]
MEIYNLNYSNQIIFFGVNLSSVCFFVIQKKLQKIEQIKSQIDHLRIQLAKGQQSKRNIKQFFSCPQLEFVGEQRRSKAVNLSFSNHDQDTGYFNHLRNQDASYISQGFLGKETLIYLTSRPTSSNKQIMGKDQISDSIQELTEKHLSDKQKQINQADIISFSDNQTNNNSFQKNKMASLFQQKKRQEEDSKNQLGSNENQTGIYENPLNNQRKLMQSSYQAEQNEDNFYDKRISINYHLNNNKINAQKKQNLASQQNDLMNSQEILKRRFPSIFYKKCKSMDNQIQKQNKLNDLYKIEQVNEEQSYTEINSQTKENLKTNIYKSIKESEYASNLNLNLKNIPNLYQVFFNFFPEGIIFMDSEMNIVYNNKSSLLLLDCTDNAQLKETISNLPNLKSEINQTYFGSAENTHQETTKNKASFESFKNLTLASALQMHEQNNFNNQYSMNYQSTNALDRSNFSHQIPTINTEESTKKNYKKTSNMHNLQINHQKIVQFNENSSYQSNKIDKSSNQQYLLYEIQKNLLKTQQFINQNHFDNIETNMILNETIIVRSKLKKVNTSTPRSTTQNQSNSFGLIQHQANLNQNNSIASIKNQSLNNNNNSNNTNNINNMNLKNPNNLYPVNNSSPVITTSNHYHIQKERTNSIQIGPIQSSIYTSTFSNMPSNNNNNLNPTSPISFQINSNQQYQSQNNHQISNNLTNSYNIIQNNMNQNQQTNLTQQSLASPHKLQNQAGKQNCNQNQHSVVGYYNIYNPSFMNFQISQQCIDKGNNSANQETNLSSEQRDFDISLFPSIIEGKAMILLMVRDVTHRKYIQHLKLANLQKQQIVSYLSHELRNPLNCIINILDTIDYDIQALKKVQQKQVDIVEIQNNIATALQNSKYILNLSNDYLDMARIKADQFKLNIQPFNLLNLLNDCIKMFNIQAYKLNTEIILRNRFIQNSFYIDQSNQFKNIIYSDQERIKQVIINLISNALKFTHNGRIFIQSEYNSLNSIQVSIKDTGIGIEKSKLKQLFKAFGKIDDEETQNYNQQGVGLGLLISNMLSIQLAKPPTNENMSSQINQNINSNSIMNINQSNQSIQQNNKQDKGLKVESEKGIGSTFTLTITDHNPSFRHNKIKVIQQIAETQESSALLSQSLYEGHLPKKQKLEADQNNVKKLKSNFPNLSCSVNKNLFKEGNRSADKIKSHKLLDTKGEFNRAHTSGSQEYKSYCSMTYISLTELQENPNQNKQKVKQNNSFSIQIQHPLNQDNKNKLEKSNQQMFNPIASILNKEITSSLQIYHNTTLTKQNSLANTVKKGPEIKNKFIEASINDMVNSKYNQDSNSIASRNYKLQRELPSPISPLKNNYQTMITSQYGKQVFTFQAEQIQQRNEQILIVDDNVFCCEALKNIIEKRFGISCMICYSATKAIEIVKQRFTSCQQPKKQMQPEQYLFDSIKMPDQQQQKSMSKLQENIYKEYQQQNQLNMDEDDQQNVQISQNRFFKFIFLDINMPDVSGFEGLYQIKSFLNQVYPNFSNMCQIIGCSGIDENFLIDQNYTNNNPLAQFDYFLIKPVLKEKLIEFFAAYKIDIIS